jgi:hypothetical protein
MGGKVVIIAFKKARREIPDSVLALARGRIAGCEADDQPMFEQIVIGSLANSGII